MEIAKLLLIKNFLGYDIVQSCIFFCEFIYFLKEVKVFGNKIMLEEYDIWLLKKRQTY